jgi:N-carbamoyl-L-amino-acid hydrolase
MATTKPAADLGARAVEELRELKELTSDDAGAQRVAWTPTWARARQWFLAKLEALPVEVDVDEAGNVWSTLRGRSEQALLIGGHIDSVPGGGWLDGALNLVAGLQVLRRVANDGVPPLTLRLVDWADEEGARFGRTCFGSSATSGSLRPDEVRELRDRDGVALTDALAEFGIDLDQMTRSRRQLTDAVGYLELHIEQGPVLERLRLPLAVVTGTAGVERHRITFRGERSHAGSTPMEDRHDALVAATHLVQAARSCAEKEGGVATVGTIDVDPGIITAVPGRCTVGLDMRHQDAAALARMLAAVRRAARNVDGGVVSEWEALWEIAPIAFDKRLIALTEQTIAALVGSCPRLTSGALHDAAEVAKAGVPSVMLFVQSLRGISHSPAEDTRPEHIELAVQALDRLTARIMAASGSFLQRRRAQGGQPI